MNSKIKKFQNYDFHQDSLKLIKFHFRISNQLKYNQARQQNYVKKSTFFIDQPHNMQRSIYHRTTINPHLKIIHQNIQIRLWRTKMRTRLRHFRNERKKSARQFAVKIATSHRDGCAFFLLHSAAVFNCRTKFESLRNTMADKNSIFHLKSTGFVDPKHDRRLLAPDGDAVTIITPVLVPLKIFRT